MTLQYSSGDLKQSKLWLALMMCDSAFPGGSFGHSIGLESAHKNGFIVDNKSSLNSYLRLVFEQAVHFSLRFVHKTHLLTLKYRDSESCNDLFKHICEVDELCHVMLTNESSRKSSISQGRGLLMISKESFIEYNYILNYLSNHMTSFNGLLPSSSQSMVEMSENKVLLSSKDISQSMVEMSENKVLLSSKDISQSMVEMSENKVLLSSKDISQSMVEMSENKVLSSSKDISQSMVEMSENKVLLSSKDISQSMVEMSENKVLLSSKDISQSMVEMSENKVLSSSKDISQRIVEMSDDKKNGENYIDKCNIDKSYLRGHYPIIFGMISTLLEIPWSLIQIMFMRNLLRDILSAACRLTIIGPYESIKLQIYYSKYIENLLIHSFISINIPTRIHDSLQNNRSQYNSTTSAVCEDQYSNKDRIITDIKNIYHLKYDSNSTTDNTSISDNNTKYNGTNYSIGNSKSSSSSCDEHITHTKIKCTLLDTDFNSSDTFNTTNNNTSSSSSSSSSSSNSSSSSGSHNLSENSLKRSRLSSSSDLNDQTLHHLHVHPDTTTTTTMTTAIQLNRNIEVSTCSPQQRLQSHEYLFYEYISEKSKGVIDKYYPTVKNYNIHGHITDAKLTTNKNTINTDNDIKKESLSTTNMTTSISNPNMNDTNDILGTHINTYTYISSEEPVTVAPILELIQSKHEQLYSRLFMS